MNCVAATDLHDYEQRELAERVAPILDAVRRRGDEALPGTALRVSATGIERCLRALPAVVINDLALAQDQMRRFAEAQRAAIATLRPRRCLAYGAASVTSRSPRPACVCRRNPMA